MDMTDRSPAPRDSALCDAVHVIGKDRAPARPAAGDKRRRSAASLLPPASSGTVPRAAVTGRPRRCSG